MAGAVLMAAAASAVELAVLVVVWAVDSVAAEQAVVGKYLLK